MSPSKNPMKPFVIRFTLRWLLEPPIEIPAGIEHADYGDRLVFLGYPEESQIVTHPELAILVLERPDRCMGWTARWEMSE